jgi:hypothetical protein
MKKNINTLFMQLIITLLISCHYGTDIGKAKKTPDEFISIIKAKQEIYLRDTLSIFHQLRTYMRYHTQSLYSKTYSDSSEILVHRILYNKDLSKIAVFVVIKTPTVRNEFISEDERAKYKYFYDGYCYLGIRDTADGNRFKLKWDSQQSMWGWYNKEDMINEMTNIYFLTFALIKDSYGKLIYGYNLNDRRFWDCPIWDKYFKEEK